MLTIAKTLVEAMKGRTGVKYNVRFVAFSAEEEGLWGSRHFVNVLQSMQKAKPEENKVYEVLTMDQVGFKKERGNGVLNAIFETVGKQKGNQHLVDVLGRTAQRLYGKSGSTDLSVNYNGFGSDHIPFLDAGLPAVLFIERDNLFYADKFGHTKYDKLENIDFDYARKMAEVATNAVLTLLLE
jgi:Zn-dependent M28 family amino/carboxypeptidase